MKINNAGNYINLKFFVILYLLITVIFYNKFIFDTVSSKLPIIFFALIFGCHFIQKLILGEPFSPHVTKIPSVVPFMITFLMLEIAHAIFDINEFISVITICGLLLFVRYTARRCKEEMIFILSSLCSVYLITIYCMCLFSGMVGVDLSSPGSFITQFLPFLGPWVVNDSFLSGRGSFSLVGGILAIIMMFRIRESGANFSSIFFVFMGTLFILLSDSRSSLVCFVIIVLLIYSPLPHHTKNRLFFAFPLFILIFQLYPLLMSDLLESAKQVLLLNRQGMSEELNRATAAAESLRLIKASLLHSLFGYGSFGAAKALEVAILQVYTAETLDSAHNMMLQILLEGGIVLASIFYLMFVRFYLVAARFIKHFGSVDLDAIAALNYTILGGMTGSILSISRVNESMTVFVLCIIAVNMQIKQMEYSLTDRLYYS